MSNESADAETPTLDVLERAGWSNAELIWEQVQEAAAAAHAAGDSEDATALWLGALEVAREHLEHNDPRLATSLVNCALDKRRTGDPIAAQTLLDEAEQVWPKTRAWVDTLRSEHRARSSTFHLRLKAKHRGAYDRFSKERYAALHEEAQTVIQACQSGNTGQSDRLTRWRRERPAGFTDMRKMLAAVLLLADGD